MNIICAAQNKYVIFDCIALQETFPRGHHLLQNLMSHQNTSSKRYYII